MSQDSGKSLAKMTGLILAISVLPQVLFMHFLLGFPSQEANSKDFYLEILSTSAAGAALYLISYFLIYRKTKMGHDNYIPLTAMLIGIFSSVIVSFAPLGLSLFLIAFLHYRKRKKEYETEFGKPPREVVLTQTVDLDSTTAFEKVRRRKKISNILYSSLMILYALFLTIILQEMGFLPFNFVFLTGQLSNMPYVLLAFLLLFFAFLYYYEAFVRESMKHIYNLLPGRTGYVSGIKRRWRNYKVTVEGLKFNAHSSSDLLLGSSVSVKKVIVNGRRNVVVLVVEP